jgi:hypothetical protein
MFGWLDQMRVTGQNLRTAQLALLHRLSVGLTTANKALNFSHPIAWPRPHIHSTRLSLKLP